LHGRRQFYRFVLEHIVIEYFIFSFKNYFLFQIRISYSCSLQETIKNWIFVEKTSLGRISRRRGGTCAVYVPEPCQNKWTLFALLQCLLSKRRNLMRIFRFVWEIKREKGEHRRKSPIYYAALTKYALRYGLMQMYRFGWIKRGQLAGVIYIKKFSFG
jgi:hypothetical protein